MINTKILKDVADKYGVELEPRCDDSRTVVANGKEIIPEKLSDSLKKSLGVSLN